MNQNVRLPTTESLRQALRDHCLSQVQSLNERLGEVVACLEDANHLGALGALSGVEERLSELTTVVKLIPEIGFRTNA